MTLNGHLWRILTGDALDVLKTLPDNYVQCVVTSPPYFGLRDYGEDGQLGLESRPDCAGWATGQPCGACYICHMVAVFAEVRRVLREDGVCFLNIGDSYAQSGMGGNPAESEYRKQATNNGSLIPGRKAPAGMKPKDLMLIPARLSLALQAAGWWVRSDIIWAKKAPMPESVRDRPTRSHEHIFLLTKSARYYWDQEAVRQGISASTMERWNGDPSRRNRQNGLPNWTPIIGETTVGTPPSGRNLRDVWLLGPKPYAAAHFATFPPAIPERCIKAGSSEWGQCAECGAPWERIVEKQSNYTQREPAHVPGNSTSKVDSTGWDWPTITEHGWQPTCDHEAERVPCIVLDPFSGAGTTGLVARRLGRRYVGIELNPEYVAMSERRILDDMPLFNMTVDA